MTEHMTPLSFKHLLNWVLAEYSKSGSIFNIPKQLFFRPSESPIYATKIFGQTLSTPVGPAAGPHTQLSQNIIAAWLTGSRFIELKTVQIMDELEIPRPCIDMADEGYNVEWSQELKLKQSASEYIHAWVIIHVLRRLLDMENLPFGTIFNMSVGYNLEGITSEPMQRFMATMQDASDEIGRVRDYLRAAYPIFADIDIPTCITNNVTLSTMHGCPPEEIQRIAEYLINDQKLHTIIKMNPTLLGRDTVLEILHNKLGFEYIDIPQKVFDADIDWNRSLELIKTLESAAADQNLHFGVKLSNTLAMRNVLGRLPGDEVYMSGRALCPLTVNLFAKLQAATDNRLNVSYSAGADAMNIADIVACGAMPVTVASDLLKPGGYSRTIQYLENLETAMQTAGTDSIESYQAKASTFLPAFADQILEDPWYNRQRNEHGLPKLESTLPEYDCVTAPCTVTCPAEQSPPAYIRRIAHGELEAGLRSILKQNPLPGMTGYVCPHTCQFKCTRNAYDESVAIRNLKRYIHDNTPLPVPQHRNKGTHIAVVGSGPAGLSAAWYLAELGLQVTIFEASSKAGGVPRLAPEFRIPESVIEADVKRIENLGVDIRLRHPVTDPPETLLEQGFDAVFYSPGFKKDLMPNIPGVNGLGVMGVLEFLRKIRDGETFEGVEDVVVIGGGNTAMDAARTAHRITGKPAKLVYRRTQKEMPAWQEEIDGLLEEGDEVIDLTSPVKIKRRKGKLLSITCQKNELGEPDASGRPRPVPIKGSNYDIKADLIIMAIGQEPDYVLNKKSGIVVSKNGRIEVNPETCETGEQHIYAGGDAIHGPSYIIQAAADGHRAATAIAREIGFDATTELIGIPMIEPDWQAIYHARTHLSHAEQPHRLAPEKRKGFEPIEKSFTANQATKEALRCLQCDLVCDRCVDVCPNRANMSVTIIPRMATIGWIKTDENGTPEISGLEYFGFKQERQIIHIDEFCNECGNCSTFCTHTGDPFRDKPRFFLDKTHFEASDGNGWFMNEFEMMRRHNGIEYHLLSGDKHYRVHIDDLVVTMTSGFNVEEMTGQSAPKRKISLVPAAEMIVMMEALKNHPVAMGR